MLRICPIPGSAQYGIFDTVTDQFLKIGGETAWESPDEIDTSSMSEWDMLQFIDRIYALWPNSVIGSSELSLSPEIPPNPQAE